MKKSVPFCLLLLLTSVALAQGQPKNPVEFIMKKVLVNTKEQDTIKSEKLVYKRAYILEDLNDNAEVTKREKEEVTLIQKDGVEKIISSSSRNSKISSPRFDLIKALETLTKFDDFEMVRIDMLGARPYYLINFKPKIANRPKANDDVEEIIIRSEGWMYVDLEKFYIKQIAVGITKSYSRGWGIFNLDRANLEMSQTEFKGIIVMDYVTLIDRYSFFGFTTFEKQTWTYQDYQQPE